MIKDSAGSFENLFYLLIVMGVVAMALNLLIRKPLANRPQFDQTKSTENAPTR